MIMYVQVLHNNNTDCCNITVTVHALMFGEQKSTRVLSVTLHSCCVPRT